MGPCHDRCQERLFSTLLLVRPGGRSRSYTPGVSVTVVMTMEVRNEADAIEDHIVYHLSVGFSAVVVSDRGSTDGTFEILDRLARELPVVVIDRSSEQITSERAMKRMTGLAVERLGATWVVEGFIDEFWLVGSGSISRLVEDERGAAGSLLAPVARFVQDPGHEHDLPHLRETQPLVDELRPLRSIRRIGAAGSDTDTLEMGECCVGISPPATEQRALQRATAWGLEELLGLDGQRAASPRWEGLFRDYLEETGTPHLDSVDVRQMLDKGELVSDPRISEALQTFDRSGRSAARLLESPSASDTSLVVVVGMHRSGTSLIARVVNLLGVDIGAESELMEAKTDNPTGFWENRSFAGLDDDLLAELGGRWDRPPIVASDWAHDPSLETYRTDATNLISETFSGSLGLVKDPRMSLVLPLWMRVAPIHSALLVLRHPEAVAASLARRDGMESELAASLWIDYTLGVLDAEADCHIVIYDEFLANPEAGARTIAAMLDLDPPNPGLIEEIASFADPALRHHDGDDGSTGTGPHMTLAINLHGAVANSNADHIEIIRDRLRDARKISALGDELHRLEQEWGTGKRVENGMIDERDQLRRRHELQDAELLELEAVSRTLADQAASAQRRGDVAQARVEALESESILARGLRRFRARGGRSSS